jgi:hypothetical protein
LAVLAWVVPRFARNPEGGFAAGATAALVLLAFLAATAVVALYLLWVTARAYRSLSPPARVAGIAPSILAVGTLLIVFGMLRY